MTGQPLRVETGAVTDVGKVRSQNEDSFLSREDVGLWVVADGMGGHEGGEWASAKIVEELEQLILPADFDAACAAVVDAIQHRFLRHTVEIAVNLRVFDEFVFPNHALELFG